MRPRSQECLRAASAVRGNDRLFGMRAFVAAHCALAATCDGFARLIEMGREILGSAWSRYNPSSRSDDGAHHEASRKADGERDDYDENGLALFHGRETLAYDDPHST
ncbi:hypothetical protein JMG10_09905 [Nostoc ellipsosporum NOK]|nr:hypothetical protein [Nostoc ellipsosporum NOK]